MIVAAAAVASPAATSVAAGAEPVPARKASAPGTVAVVFVGDIMLDNGPGHAIASGRDPFADCADLLLDADFTVGNLECVLG
jgi:poly-gamma-glutamate synthesis protein (capsule biosynthesis protein)